MSIGYCEVSTHVQGPRVEPAGLGKRSRGSRKPDPLHETYFTGQSESNRARPISKWVLYYGSGGVGSGIVCILPVGYVWVRSEGLQISSIWSGRLGSGQERSRISPVLAVQLKHMYHIKDQVGSGHPTGPNRFHEA